MAGTKYGTTFRGCMTQIGESHPVRELGACAPQPVLCSGGRREPAGGLHGQPAQGRAIHAGRACASRPGQRAHRPGEPLFDKLDADIAYAMMGINAVKGVEIGAGFASVARQAAPAWRFAHAPGFCGQQRRRRAGRHQHRAGPGGGIAIKPTSSIIIPRDTIDIRAAHRSHHQGPARPLCGHTRHAHCRGHAGAGGDGARSCASARCTRGHAGRCASVAAAPGTHPSTVSSLASLLFLLNCSRGRHAPAARWHRLPPCRPATLRTSGFSTRTCRCG
jgi:hypothetical protein